MKICMIQLSGLKQDECKLWPLPNLQGNAFDGLRNSTSH